MAELLFQLRKVLPTLLLPIGLTLLLLALALRLKRRTPAYLAVLLLTLSSLPFVGQALTRQLENQYPRLDAELCPPAEAILVLGGIVSGTTQIPGMPTQFNDAVDRFESGIQLFRLHKAPTLLFTSSGNPGFDEGELLRRAAIDHGVPNEAIRLAGPANTTATEALAVKRTGLKRVILVTSAFHMARAALLFRRAGLDIVPFPTDYRQNQATWRLEDLFPTADALSRTELALHEIYGNLLYRLTP